MNTQELWQRYQDWLYFNEDLGLYLDVSRMRFNDLMVESLEPKFAQGGHILKCLGKFWLQGFHHKVIKAHPADIQI